MKYRVYKKIAALGVFAVSLTLENSAFAGSNDSIDAAIGSVDSLNINTPTKNINTPENADKPSSGFFAILDQLDKFQSETKKLKEDEAKRQDAFKSILVERDKQFSEIIQKLVSVASSREGLADLKKFLDKLPADQKINFQSVIKDVSASVAKFDVENKKTDGFTKSISKLTNALAPLSNKATALKAESDALRQKLNEAMQAHEDAGSAAMNAAMNAGQTASLNAQIDALSGKIANNQSVIKNNLSAKQREKDDAKKAAFDSKIAALKTEITTLESQKTDLSNKISALSNASSAKDPQAAQKDVDDANKAVIAKDRELKSVEKQKAALEASLKKVNNSLTVTLGNVDQYQAQLIALLFKLGNVLYGNEKLNPTEVPAVQPEQDSSSDLNDLLALENQNAKDQQNILSGDNSLNLVVPNESIVVNEQPTVVPNNSVVAPDTNDFDAPSASAPAVPAEPTKIQTTAENVNQFIKIIQSQYSAATFDFKNPTDQDKAFKRCAMGVKLALNGDSKVRNLMSSFMAQNAQATGVARLGQKGGLDASAKSKLYLLTDKANGIANLDTVRTQICGK